MCAPRTPYRGRPSRQTRRKTRIVPAGGSGQRRMDRGGKDLDAVDKAGTGPGEVRGCVHGEESLDACDLGTFEQVLGLGRPRRGRNRTA